MGPRQWMANVQCFLDTLFLVQQSLVPIVMATGLPSHIRYLSVIIRYVWAVGFHTCYTQGPRIFCLRLLILLCGYQHPFPAISPQPCSIPRSFQFSETSVLSIPYGVTCMSLLGSVQCLSPPFVLFPSTVFQS